jgi:hypothetical protein
MSVGASRAMSIDSNLPESSTKSTSRAAIARLSVRFCFAKILPSLSNNTSIHADEIVVDPLMDAEMHDF